MGGKLKVILRENWDEFYYLYQKNIRKNVFDEVEKVLKCKDIIKYKCTKFRKYIKSLLMQKRLVKITNHKPFYGIQNNYLYIFNIIFIHFANSCPCIPHT